MHPVPALEPRLAPGTERVEHLAAQARELEALSVPELVGTDDLRAGDPRGKRRLACAAVPSDPDERESPRRGGGGDEIEDGPDVHDATLAMSRRHAVGRANGLTSIVDPCVTDLWRIR